MRKRLKITITLLIVLIVLPALLVFLAIHTGLVRSYIDSQLNAAIPAGIPLQIAIGDVSGPYYNGLVIRNIAVIDTNSPADTILAVRQAELSYRISDIWHKRWIFKRAVFQGLRLSLPPDSTLDAWSRRTGSTEGPRRKKAIDLQVDTLAIVNADSRAAGKERWHAEGLTLSAAVRLVAGAFSCEIYQMSFDLPELSLNPVKIHGAVRATDSGWNIDSLEVITPQSAVRLAGPVGVGKSLQVRTDPVSLDEISRIFGSGITGSARYDGTVRIDSTGRVSGKGTLAGEINGRVVQGLSLAFHYCDKRVDVPYVRGTALAARFAGSGYMDLAHKVPVYGYAGRVDGFNLNNVAFQTFASNLSGHVWMDGWGLSDKDMSMEFDLKLEGGRFDDYTFDSADGHLEVTTESTTFDDGFMVSYKHTVARVEGFVEYQDSVDIFANVYFNDLRDFDGQTFVDSLDGRGYAYCTLIGKTASPDLIGRFESDSLRVFDLHTAEFFGHFNVRHVFDDRAGQAALSWGAALGWSLPLDSLTTRLRFTGTEVFIDSARAYFPVVSVRSNGWLDWRNDTIPIRLYDFAGVFQEQRFFAPDTIHWTIDTGGFAFEPFVIEGELGQLWAEGRVEFDTRMDARLSVDGFHFTPYWQRVFPEFPLAGQVQLQADLGGNFEYPHITGSGTASDLTYLGEPIGELTGAFSYQARQLRVDSATLVHPEWRFTGQGVFPIDLAFAPVKPRVLPIPQDFTVTGRGKALAPVTWFLPDVVEAVRGPWEMSIQLTGTPQQPLFGGWARLDDGTVKTVEIENPIEEFNVVLELHHDTIKIVRANGKINGRTKNPNISATGTIIVESVDSYLYNLRLVGEEIPAQFEFQDYELAVDVDVAVTGSSPPLVSGTITVLRGEDREPFSYDEEIILPDTSLWDWDLAILAPGNYWIRNDQVQAELELDLRLLREYGVVSVLGNAEFIPGRGKVYVFDRMGRIERGELIFDQPESSDPRLDLELSFRIPSTATEQSPTGTGRTEYARDVDLTLLVTGYASEPLISSAEGSPYSDQDILLLLAANRPMTMDTPAEQGGIYLDRIRFAATNLFFSQLEREMARTLGIETISVQPGASTAETELTVGSYFLRNFYVYGSSRVALDRGQEVGFEYRLRRGLYFDGRRDEKNQYRLNLHLNLEY